jgi:hypothetical protein
VVPRNRGAFAYDSSGVHAGTAADHKGLAARAERTAAEGEVERAKAAEHAARAKERVERIARGENVEGGLANNKSTSKPC